MSGCLSPYERHDSLVSLRSPRASAPPASEQELLARAEGLAGQSLLEVATAHSLAVPADLRRAKGWVGGLLERALGANAGSRDEPDFVNLGIELKTLPVDDAGRPLESTFVCTIGLLDIADVEWQDSRLWRKLSRVLWVPVEGTRSIPVAERRVGSAFVWSPSPRDRQRIRADWDELTQLIARGCAGDITGHLGEVLQVRPKAARGASRRRAFDDEGSSYDEQPKGFYLRPTFTASLIAARFR